MKKLSFVSLAIALALAVSPAVSTAQNEDFTINITGAGLDFTGSGTFLTTPGYTGVGGSTGADGYLITSFTGSLNAAPYNGGVSLVPSPPPGGEEFMVSDIEADNLFYPGNNVAGSGTGFLDNSGLIVSLTGEPGYYANILTGTSVSTGAAGTLYWVFYSPTATVQFSTAITSALVTVPEFGSLSMLLLCTFILAGAFFFKGRQSGLFLNA